MIEMYLRHQLHVLHLYNKPHHVKCALKAYADNEDPDQTAHMRSLIRAFAVRLQNNWIL